MRFADSTTLACSLLSISISEGRIAVVGTEILLFFTFNWTDFCDNAKLVLSQTCLS